MISTCTQKVARALLSNSTRSGHSANLPGTKGTNPANRLIGADSPDTCLGKYVPFNELYKPPKDSPTSFARNVQSVGPLGLTQQK